MRLSVMTLNMWNYNEPLQSRTRNFHNFLEGGSIDAICLQEMPIGFDQLARPLVEMASRHSLPCGAPLQDQQHCNSIWTQEISEIVGALPLSSSRRGGARTALAVLHPAKGPGRPVLIVTTHLSHEAEDETLRLTQAGEIINLIQRIWFNYGRCPTILAGDLNCTDAEPAYRRLAGSRTALGLQDVQTVAGLASIDTFSSRNPYVQSDLRPDRRIDYILATSDWNVRNVEVVFDRESTGFVSDHFGVLANLEL